MGKIVQKDFDSKVATIAARDNIINKHVGTTVIVENAIDDVNAGPGSATYVWNGTAWSIVSKEYVDAAGFSTGEKHLIVNGSVTLDNVPLDESIWEVSVNEVESNDVLYHLAQEDLNITNNVINGLEEYNGYNLRVSYAYGTLVAQVETFVNTAIAESTGSREDFDAALDEALN
jgi:hypothetical protein